MEAATPREANQALVRDAEIGADDRVAVGVSVHKGLREDRNEAKHHAVGEEGDEIGDGVLLPVRGSLVLEAAWGGAPTGCTCSSARLSPAPWQSCWYMPPAADGGCPRGVGVAGGHGQA
eukprot:2108507-Pleurochrysis_carterae.AAC.3